MCQCHDNIRQLHWYTHPPTCDNLAQTVGRFNMWVTPKTNKSSFCLIILKLSHVLDGLFSVLSRLHRCKHRCTFCRMKHHWTRCDYFQILLLGILSSMEPIRYTFSDIPRCFEVHFPGFGHISSTPDLHHFGSVCWLFWVLFFT